MTKSANLLAVTSGHPVVYTLTVTNGGPSPATGAGPWTCSPPVSPM